MNTIAAMLREIEGHSLGLGRSVTLRPGRQRSEILRAASQVGLTFPEALVHLYEAADGASCHSALKEQQELLPSLILMDLEWASETYNSRLSSSMWLSNWWPLLTEGGQVDVFVDVNSPDTSTIEWERDFENSWLFPSLEAYLSYACEAFRCSAFYMERGHYVTNFDLKARLAKQVGAEQIPTAELDAASPHGAALLTELASLYFGEDEAPVIYSRFTRTTGRN